MAMKIDSVAWTTWIAGSCMDGPCVQGFFRGGVVA
jgi:hypothetical protein